MRRFCFAACLAVLAFPAAAADVFSVPVKGDFNEDYIEWTGGLGKSYEFRWDVILVEGKVAICGAGKFLDPTTRAATVDILRYSTVLLDGRVVMMDLSYFAKYKAGQDLSAVKANCRSTGAAPKGADSQVELQMSGQARF